MNKEWKKPELEVLDVKMTAMGPTTNNVDFSYSDDNENVELHS